MSVSHCLFKASHTAQIFPFEPSRRRHLRQCQQSKRSNCEDWTRQTCKTPICAPDEIRARLDSRSRNGKITTNRRSPVELTFAIFAEKLIQGGVCGRG
ncbi:hypothetical protein MTP99_001888 [Tenebrio molitor]|nr:hypothetical protein MTP99_001888 [Tenebrio molitor]